MIYLGLKDRIFVSWRLMLDSQLLSWWRNHLLNVEVVLHKNMLLRLRVNRHLIKYRWRRSLSHFFIWAISTFLINFIKLLSLLALLFSITVEIFWITHVLISFAATTISFFNQIERLTYLFTWIDFIFKCFPPICLKSSFSSQSINYLFT